MTNQTAPTQPAAKANTAAAGPATVPTPAPLPPAPEGMLNVFVDGVLLHVKKGSTVMQACTQAEKEIPHFCYHERLSIAGNCRMCLVEIEGMPKPVASCHWPVSEGMKVRTDSKMTMDARKGTMELLLINHPLDCPICDQGGECALQDQAVAYGSDRSHYHEAKRAVDDKNIGHKIKTVMTRCIHCTRCVRFATEIAGVEEFGATGRGENTQIGTYVEQALQSELAGNMIDLCPVGALTSAPYAFTARPWELKRYSSVDVLDAVGAPIHVDVRADQVMRVLPQENDAINEEWLTDTARFSYDALHANRLTRPLLEGKPVNWPEAFDALQHTLKDTKPDQIAGLFGALQSAEDAFAFKAFIQDVLKSPHLDSRPAETLAIAPTFNGSLRDIEASEAILLLGCNPRLEAPLLNIRLRRAALKRRVPIYAIGPEIDLTYPHKNLGNNPETLSSFNRVTGNGLRVTVLVGYNLLTRPDAEALLAEAAKLGTVHILADTSGRITSHSLGVLPTAKGKGTEKILNAWHKGTLKVLFIHGDDTVDAMDLQGGSGTLIYLGTHNTPLAKRADIVFPTAAWSEKQGLYMNAEGRVQAAHMATHPPLMAKEDWKIYRALSEELGSPLPFNTLAQLREKLALANPAYSPENLNKLPQPATYHLPPTTSSVSDVPLNPSVEKFYLRLEYLKQSPTMAHIQAETGGARINPQPHPVGEGPAGRLVPAKATLPPLAKKPKASPAKPAAKKGKK